MECRKEEEEEEMEMAIQIYQRPCHGFYDTVLSQKGYHFNQMDMYFCNKSYNI